MIQEIYDYLLIKSYFASEDETGLQLETEDNAKEQFKYIVENVALLMQEEDFFLLIPDIQEQLTDIIQKYRFKYKSKEIYENINFIIDTLNRYKRIPENRKEKLINEWYKNEYKDRNLPFKYRNKNTVMVLCAIDFSFFDELIKNQLSIDVFNKKMIINESDEINNIIPFLSLINLMINRFEDFMLDIIDIEELYYCIDEISVLPNVPKECLKYIKVTLKQLDKLYTKKQKIKRLEK